MLPLVAGGLAECMASVARGQAPTALSLEPGRCRHDGPGRSRLPGSPGEGSGNHDSRIASFRSDRLPCRHRRDADGTLRVAGGRVLNVTAVASSFAEAQAKSREAAEAIQFDGKVFRRDIGWREAARLTSRV